MEILNSLKILQIYVIFNICPLKDLFMTIDENMESHSYVGGSTVTWRIEMVYPTIAEIRGLPGLES